MEIIKLGTIVKDKVTALKGMLTMFSLDMNKNEHYLFQPAGLNPKTREPLDSFWVTEPRIVGGEKTEIELAVEILDTQVEDKATGFNGTAIQLFYHLNGCLHVDVKPEGIIKETGESIKARDFDIRRLKGKAIKELTEVELIKSRTKNPSPEYRPGMNVR